MKTMGIIFANDGNMGALTEKRTMASLPFGGRYRQVDFALSNLTCAGVRHLGIITRHSYQSLMHHIGSGEEWGLELGEGSKVETNAVVGGVDKSQISVTSKGAVVKANTVLAAGEML